MNLIQDAGYVLRRCLVLGALATPVVGAGVLALANSADSAAPADATEPSAARSVVDLPTDEATYGSAQSCINLRSIRGHTILDGGHIVFHLPRGRYMLSQLQPRCSALRRNDVIQLNPGSIARLCALDKVSVLGAAFGSGGLQVIDTCFLGAFEEISKEQLHALKDSVRVR